VAHVLLVEDEPAMQTILRDNLEVDGHKVTVAGTGEDGLATALHDLPELIVLDLMLPGLSGYEVCSRLRAAGMAVPIIMVSARNQELDRVAGLELGANDYVGKPFSVRELLARIRVHLRSRDTATTDVWRFGELAVDVTHRSVTRRSRRIEMSSREFDLLMYLAARSGQVVTRAQLLVDVWGLDESTMTRTVDSFVMKLRKKIERDHAHPRHILTVHREGYRFVP
jgi:DNA-binding response OmpR family regulator